jgi:hypothetical protein
MIVEPSARTSLLLVLLLGACTPVPSKPAAGEKAAEEAKPEDLCKHVRELADKDSDDAAVLEQVERECIETLSAMQTRYQTFTTCVGLAADAKALYECEKSLAQRSLLAGASPKRKVEQVCDHVLGMLEQQLGAAGQVPPDELDTLREQCINESSKLVEQQGAEAFDKEADCILQSQTLEQVQACGL